MTDRPILFSGPMVRAILEGRKRQTRRLVMVPWRGAQKTLPYEPYWFDRDGKLVACDDCGRYWPVESVLRPYGQPGDRLWVRETWGYRGAAWNNQKPNQHEVTIAYQADDARRDILRYGEDWDDGLPKQHPPPEPRHPEDWDAIDARNAYFGRWWKSWRPSIHMPRWASRLTLEVEAVRVERLQSISEDDAKAEGVAAETPPGFRNKYGEGARAEFGVLWDSINGKRASWESNPWVWVVTFRKVKP